ncbi:MAG: hypothetical protein JOZ15_14650 [Acidobacteria bacterium]|nr:hypothetical protein [Acidobacteriota bacterium]
MIPSTSRRRWPALVLLAACWGFAGGPVVAHELGPFQVYGTFLRGGSFRLDVKIDEEHLAPAQLGGPARPTRYGRIAGLGGATEQRFGRFLSELADSLTLTFDGARVLPALSMEPAEGGAGGLAPARATLRVEGWIPGGARSFSFASSLPVKSYPLVLRCEDDESATWRWAAGGETSPPYELAARVVPPRPAAVARRCFALGFGQVLPHGPLALLLVAAMFLLTRRVGAALPLLAALALGQAAGLALALRGGLSLPAARLEPLLALSVAGLAVAGLSRLSPRRRSLLRGAASSPPPRLAGVVLVALEMVLLVVGVLFGLAFAPAASGGIAASGGPSGGPPLPPPLLPAVTAGFALGAAAAELAVMAAAFSLVGLPFRDQPWYRARVVVPASCLIALVALYWSLSGLLS